MPPTPRPQRSSKPTGRRSPSSTLPWRPSRKREPISATSFSTSKTARPSSTTPIGHTTARAPSRHRSASASYAPKATRHGRTTAASSPRPSSTRTTRPIGRFASVCTVNRSLANSPPRREHRAILRIGTAITAFAISRTSGASAPIGLRPTTLVPNGCATCSATRQLTRRRYRGHRPSLHMVEGGMVFGRGALQRHVRRRRGQYAAGKLRHRRRDQSRFRLQGHRERHEAARLPRQRKAVRGVGRAPRRQNVNPIMAPAKSKGTM